MTKVDVTTWCSENSLAGKYLADELSHLGDDSLSEKVGTYFQKFNTRMKALNSLEKHMRVFYLQLLLEKTQRDVYKNIRYEKIASLMLNIITAIHRNELIKINCK